MIVVTGAAGFIGSNVVAALNEQGQDDIVVCDWLRQDGRWMNLRKRMFRDFVFPEKLLEFLAEATPDAIVHLGANSSTMATDGDELIRQNFKFTLSLLDYCTARNVAFVYASSAATYGDGTNGFVDDDSLAAIRTLRPLNLYGWSKHLVDQVVAERIEKKLPLPRKCIGLKYFNVYGQNEYHKGSMISVVGKNHAAVIRGEAVTLFKSHRKDYEDGGQLRDFVYVDDAAAVTTWFIRNGPAHGLFNVGTGVAASFRELAEALFAATGRIPNIRYVPMPDELRDRYQYFTRASAGKLREAGYSTPFASVAEGVARYVHYLNSADRYR
ncbi:ADP-glyceromanno-heptose 6-epimerase precursor [Enhydrobacter aerosaccus]|uniref:ADP-L-glycero-D-manno-heptose-6-epimerase n=1 Tax=Enhydrobacter aerosaccus TaxID=225324 RepID=A0A1T4SBP4_9HYPH|nr:ADP-glyceromanno-heptose 6-epimerase [Enhydrobacter aerosaccus]SKA25730.1 ADP-glyceromanno-heptose 6-epimerase precursor [Enhydrobacter aerosaccus]